MQGYCLKCKTKKEIKDAEETVLKNRMKAVKGTCPDCGTRIFRILKKEGKDAKHTNQ